MSRASIRIVDSGDGRLHVRWFCRESGLWRDVLESFKSYFPTHHDRSYSPRTRTWSVPRWRCERLAGWIDEWFEPDEQEWLDEEPAGSSYGSRPYSDTRSSYDRYGKTPVVSSTVERAYAELHLLPTAPPELVQAAHRVLIKLSHPDSGGSHEAAVAVNAAWEVVSRHLCDSERRAS